MTIVGARDSTASLEGTEGLTYLQLSRVLPPDSVQESLLELVQECRGGARQDPTGLRAALPQLEAALPPCGLRND